MEIWKVIEEYPNYMVSNLGNVKSLNYNHTGKEKILKSCKVCGGYIGVNLCKDGEKSTKLIHRLVAEAFIPNTDNKPCIDHINTDRTDNRVENLRWVTRTENMNNPITKIKLSERQKGEKSYFYNKLGKEHHSSIPILQFDLEGCLIKKWYGISEAKRETDINNISACCRRKIKTAGGFKWEYYDLELYLESKLFKTYGIKNKMVA